MKLEGIVTSIVRNDITSDLIVFKIKASGKIYKCKYHGFLPLDTSDAISLEGSEIDGEIIIKDKPFVIIPTNSENIKNCIFKAIRGKGIGPKKAEAVFDEIYGKHESPERISKIINHLDQISDPIPKDFKFESLTKIQTSKLLNWWNKNFTKRRLYLLGLFDSEIKKSGMRENILFRSLKENPFKVSSISLEKAGEINKIFGNTHTPKELRCGSIVRKVQEYITGGWSGCPEILLKKLFPYLEGFKEELEEKYDIVVSKELYYNFNSFRVELNVCERINEMIRFTTEGRIREKSMPKLSKGYEVFEEQGVVLTDEQIKALEGSLKSYISIITGGAGCGKTTLIKQLIKNFSHNNEKFLLTSFTGKAVLRIRETLGGLGNFECCTLHRIIHKKKTGQKIEKFYNLVIDECSMISTELMEDLFKHFNHKFRLILIGDCNQLPPIGTGSFFTQLINSGRIPIYYLTKNKRIIGKNKKMTILENANGLIDPSRDKKIPFNFVSDKGFYQIDAGIEYCIKILQSFKSKETDMKDITMITPYNKDVDVLVKAQQMIFLDPTSKREFNGVEYFLNDRVMQTNNIYRDEFDLMNGEEGTIIKIDNDKLVVDYGNDKLVDYLFGFKKEEKRKKKKSKEEEEEEERSLFVSDIKHSFCKTVHKSQGSEYKYVVFFIPKTFSGFVNINLLYTGITRTKEKIWLVGDKKSIEYATTKLLPQRYEKLSERLEEMRMEDEDILEDTSKKKIEIVDEITTITSDDIWDCDYDNEMPQEMMDYYNM